MYIGGEQLRTSMKATSLPSCPVLLIDLQEKIYYNAIDKFCACQQDSGLLFIMCGHCSPRVVWYNYIAWHISINDH